jgi:hypothetical protein
MEASGRFPHPKLKKCEKGETIFPDTVLHQFNPNIKSGWKQFCLENILKIME